MDLCDDLCIVFCVHFGVFADLFHDFLSSNLLFGSPCRSILVPCPPFGSLLPPQGVKSEKNDFPGGKLVHFGSQNGARMEPKGSKNEHEIDVGFLIVFLMIFYGV